MVLIIIYYIEHKSFIIIHYTPQITYKQIKFIENNMKKSHGNLKNLGSGLCLIPDNSTTNENLLNVAPCENNTDHLWHMNNNNTIRNYDTNQCIVSSDHTFNFKSNLQKCDERISDSNIQIWSIQPYDSNIFQLTNHETCLDVISDLDKYDVINKKCNYSSNQMWKFIPILDENRNVSDR